MNLTVLNEVLRGLVGFLSLSTAAFFGSTDALAITGALIYIGFVIDDKERRA